MKLEIALITLLTLSGLFLFHQESTPSYGANGEDIQVLRAYQSWKSEYGQNFNGADDQYRFIQFKANYNFINEHNASGDQLVLGLNEYAAMNNEEFKSVVLMQQGKQVQASDKPAPATNEEIDWVAKGAVLPTKNQGNCGSCWAFSAIGGLEGLRQITTGTLEPLSAQQLVSCIPKSALDPGAKDGCGGSEAHYAYAYTHEQGIETWANYPYVSGRFGKVPECTHKKKDSVFFNKGDKSNPEGYITIPVGDVPAIKQALSQQPLSIAVAAGNVFFQFYRGGIIKSPNCGTALDHAILLVGMNDGAETPYWTVQNSWGKGWGINGGFARIAITEGDGVCGINMQVEYPTSIHQ